MMKAFRSLLLGSLTLILAACGFHLKGFYEVPSALQRLTLVENTQQPTELGRELIAQLKQNGITIESKADIRLVIEPARYNRRAVILDSSANAKEYELSGEAGFAIYQGDSEAPAVERRVTALRTVLEQSTGSTDATLSQETLESRYRKEINAALAEQIIRQYLSYVPR
jgi:LPS-assembly lipoprotein